MIELLIFRHGETDWNVIRRMQGHSDIPLNANGRAQAEALRTRLEEFSPEIILSSDLSRARVTAEIANENLRAPMLVHEALRECTLGECEGLLWEEINQNYGPELLNRYYSLHPDDMDARFPGAESKREHLTRLIGYLEAYLLENQHHKRVAVSTHGASMRRLIYNAEGVPSEPLAFPNGGTYRLDFCTRDRRWIYVKV